MKEKIKIGMSSCLLGEEVRWDGDHKYDQYVRDVLGSYFDYVSICPEVDVGMGVPRETVALYGTLENPKMITKRSKTDWTKKMNHYTKDRIHELTKENLCGYVFKSKSPSCGIGKVPIYSEFGSSRIRYGSGMFTSSFIKAFPLVPVEDEGRLHDQVTRENFIVRIFCFHRLQFLVKKSFSINSLVRFHARHKFLILSHNRKKYDDMEQLVASAKKIKKAEVYSRYSKLFMEALSYKSTPKKNMDVLLQITGLLKQILTKEEKKDILSVIEDYRNELLPLVVPVTLIYHQVKKHNIEYLLDQVYLNPHLKELMLRNHV
jgi:uncharacterized protein YbgA (DUF1722 family)/uncharacterized protein YbbK (DUF523 family)